MIAGPASGVVPFVLNQFYHLQSTSQALVVNDGALVQFSQPVEGYKGQGSTVSPELDSTVRILPDINILPIKTPVFFIIFKKIKLLIIL